MSNFIEFIIFWNTERIQEICESSRREMNKDNDKSNRYCEIFYFNCYNLRIFAAIYCI